jgi:outer membrane receptor protein involved in Fe transport
MESVRSKFSVLAIALVLVFSTTLAFGQGIVTGTISGTVVDPDGAVVSGATVTAKDAATNRTFTTTSDAGGAFALRGLPVGLYAVTIDAPGFKKAQISGVQVFVGRETAMGARALTIGSEGEVVDVEGTAPLVEATSSQVSSSFESRKVTDIPVAGNNGFDALALLVPGAASAGDAGFSNQNGADVAVNGQRGRSNNFQIDGQSNNDNSVAGPQYFIGNPDIIAEFQIITNNYSAEFGRNMGSVVNYVTKSGTNNFHGTAFWFHSNVATSSLANEEKNPNLGFCLPGQDPIADGCTEPEKFDFRQNRFGGTLGGPVVTDKLWFFGSFLDDRFRGAGGVASSGALFTPTPAGIAQLQAAFPGNAAVAALANFGPYGVSTGSPFVQAGSTFTQVVTGPGGVTAPIEFGAVQRVAPARTDNREWVGRLDYQLSDKDRIFGRYLFQGANFASPTGVVTNANVAAGSWVDVPSRTHQVGLDWSRTWTSHFINQVRVSYSRADIAFEGGSYGLSCTRANLTECPSRIAFQDTTLTFGQQSTFPQGRLVNNTQYQDNASWVLGRHTIKFGGEYSRQRSPNIFLPNINGTYTFANFNAFLQSSPVSLSLTEGPEGIRFKEQDMALYLQDDWRVRDNLTLNLGLRWERFEQAINALNDLTVARESDPAQAFWDPTLPLELRTVPQVPEDNNNVGPNVGFAWTPRLWEGLFGRDKTVIRGGYRIAYDPAFYNIFLNAARCRHLWAGAAGYGSSIPQPDHGGGRLP